MRRQLLPALGMLLVFTVITGLAYPLVVTGVAQGLFADRANGSLVEGDGQLVGSALIGQPFSAPEYFHPRPSAAGYAPGPTALDRTSDRPTRCSSWRGRCRDCRCRRVGDQWCRRPRPWYRETNGLDSDVPVPVDAVTSSGSGLDPHISWPTPGSRRRGWQTNRGLDVDQVLELIEENTDGRGLGFLGEPGVNVLLLNLASTKLG